MTDIIKTIADAHAASLGIGAVTEAPPEARDHFRRAGSPRWLDQAPPRPTANSQTVREMVRDVAARTEGQACITFTEDEWTRLVSLAVRDFGDAIEAGGFVWTTAQIGEVRAFMDGFLRECGFFDGSVFRPVTIIEEK